MASTKYILEVSGELTDFMRSSKATVVAEAERVRKENKVGVRVVTGTGHEAFALAAPRTHVVTFHTKPYTKTIALPEDIASLVPEGYVAAYARPRNHAVVLRNENADAEADEKYAVLDDRTGNIVAHVARTRDAGQVMKGMKVAKAA